MKKFFSTFLYFALPGLVVLFILSAGYAYFDPFKVLKSYKDYSYPYVSPNRDHISTQMFINNYPKYHYNSFVFGSSRTLAYNPASWVKHLAPDAKPFVFDASSETIYGMYTKLKYLDSLNVDIKNVLMIVCRDDSFASAGNQEGHLFMKDPVTSGTSKLDFQATIFKAYLNPKFLLSFYYYKATNRYKPFMQGYIENRKVSYDTVTNRLRILDQENDLKTNPTKYYADREKIFYTRKGETVDSVQRIQGRFLFMLTGIKKIFDKHKTNYKVVISPLYEQKKFNAKDMVTLRGFFGDRLYDFSGKNSFTDSKFNYFENSHYRIEIGDSILNKIYQPVH